MSEEYYPNLQMADLSHDILFATEVVPFETGWTQRNALWRHPIAAFTLSYELLKLTEYDDLLNFYLRHRGQLEPFWFTDYTDDTPRARTFGVGDGVTTLYKLQHDRNANPVIFVDGAGEANVYVNPDTGWVRFDTAPAAGTVLTYDADDCAYRCRFGDDNLPSARHKAMLWGTEVKLVQDIVPEDAYPISQIIYGMTQVYTTIDAIGEAIAFSFVAPLNFDVVTADYYTGIGGAPGNVKVSLCSNQGGLPGAELASNTQAAAGPGWQMIALAYSCIENTRYWLVIEADSGTWNAGNWLRVYYTDGPPIGNLWRPNSLNYGAFTIADHFCKNTENAGLAVATRNAGLVWSEPNYDNNGAFWLNTVGNIVGCCHGVNAGSGVEAANRVRQVLLVSTTHDIAIDRVGAVCYSGAVAPVDDLYYRIEFLSAPGVTQRSGTLARSRAQQEEFVEVWLTSPLTITVGETVYIEFYSPLSIAPAQWAIMGHFDGEAGGGYPTGWVAGWDAATYNGATQNIEASINAGATWPTSYRGALAIKCHGWWEA